MRYSAEHKAATRQRVLETAGALAKEKGFGTTGIDALVGAAGLTAGAFYAHFSSKSELLEALVEHELDSSLQQFELDNPEALVAAFMRYLSLGHVEYPARGCALPVLSAEVARASDAARDSFEQRLIQLKDRLQAHLLDEDQAWSALAQAVGAVMLARAMRTQTTRKALLGAVRRTVAAKITAPAVAAPPEAVR